MATRSVIVGFAILVAACAAGCSTRTSRPGPAPVAHRTLALGPGVTPVELTRITAAHKLGYNFYLGTYEVTNAQYHAFVAQTDYDGSDHPSSKPTEAFLADWVNGRFPDNTARYPVSRVNWYHADAFCRWLSARSGAAVRLPTVAEWQWAARGPSGRVFPWGDNWDPTRCNWGDGGDVDGFDGPAPVGSYPTGASPEGVQDLAGNIWEWSAERYLLGGPWCMPAEWQQSERVGREDAGRADDKFGFRVVVEIE